MNWFQYSIIQQQRQTSKAELSSLTVEGLHLVFTWYKWVDLIQQQVQKHVFTPCICFFPSASLLPWSRLTQILERNVPAQIASKDMHCFHTWRFQWCPVQGARLEKLSCVLPAFFLSGVYQPQAQSVSAFMSCQWVVLTRFTAFKKSRAGLTLYCLEKQMPTFLWVLFMFNCTREDLDEITFHQIGQTYN